MGFGRNAALLSFTLTCSGETGNEVPLYGCSSRQTGWHLTTDMALLFSYLDISSKTHEILTQYGYKINILEAGIWDGNEPS